VSNISAVEIVVETIVRYIKERCNKYFTYISICNQKHIEIEFYGLYRSYISSEKYPKFIDAVREAFKENPKFDKEYGFKIDFEAKSIYIDLDKLREICGER
jgi:hypothetical protein